MMKEAQARGYGIFSATLPNLSLKNSRGMELWAEGSEIEIFGVGRRPFYKIKKKLHFELSKAKAIFLRKDPPFDLTYLQHLYLLGQLRGRVYMMNDPVGIAAVSEKVFPFWFPEYIPKTCITSSWEEAKAFSKNFKKGVILKPLNSSGGRQVFKFSPQDSNLQIAFEALNPHGNQYVICQEFLPAVQKGDKRVILLGGQILGAFARIPSKGSHRANLHSGGSLKKCSLSVREKEISKAVGLVMLRYGIDFAGIDLIGEKLTEINVTSPMGLKEINSTQNIRSEKLWMDFVEWRIGSKNASPV